MEMPLKSEGTDLLFRSLKIESDAKSYLRGAEKLGIKNEVELHEENPGQSSEKRKSLWEISVFYHCSIMGTCLTIPEQKKMLAKEKIPYKNYSLYDIHSTILLNAREENRISCRITKLLNRKYRREILDTSDCDEGEFLSIWGEKLKVGEICGFYWAAMIRGDFTAGTRIRLFGDVHSA